MTATPTFAARGAASLDAAFALARSENRAALVGYLPVGFPSVAGSIEAMIALVEGGADIVEVGIPYSDPLMDGPTIQDAVDKALKAGVHARDMMPAVRAVAEAGAAVVTMGYWNMVEQYGLPRYGADLAAHGAAGMITPDLIPDEAGPWLQVCAANDLAPIFLVAPSSPDARIRRVAEVNRGFVYAASTMGVTGTRASVDDAAPTLVARVKAVTDLPVAVGLGVSDGAQAAQVASYADGVVVGSALVRALADGGPEAVRRLAEELSQGVRSR